MSVKKDSDRADLRRRAILAGVAGGSLIAPWSGRSAGLATVDPPKREHETDDAQSPTVRDAVDPPVAVKPLAVGTRPASDFVVDVLKSLHVEYIAANPGSSFRAIHESIINYGGNREPELLTCLHEESSVAMAHGYARACGKPMGVMLHSVVGLQHGSMAIYNAFCDRIPVLMISANVADATQRRPFIEWVHSAQDSAEIVRPFTKWDDQPGSLQHLAESLARGYKLSTAEPAAPVLIVADSVIQEHPIATTDSHLSIPKRAPNVPPVADGGDLDQLARMLLAAENPVLLADRYARTEEGIANLVALAELVGAAVCDLGSRFNFPTTHPLNQSARKKAVIAAADLVVALEPVDLWGALAGLTDQPVRTEARFVSPSAKIASISLDNVILRSNFQDFDRYQPVDLAITGDAEASLPLLLERLRLFRMDSHKALAADRSSQLGRAHELARARDREAAAVGWEVVPISTARMCMEIWNLIKDEDWALASPTYFVSYWPQRLWAMTKAHHFTGAIGGGGIGGTLSAAVGAALANRAHGRITVNIQPDGDFMYAPGALWTAAHHQIPLLTVMHNNRAYHQELMHVQRMAARNERGLERAKIGCVISDPNIDYASIARGMGVWAEGPITSPANLGPALSRALAVVKGGKPALIDVVTQPR